MKEVEECPGLRLPLKLIQECSFDFTKVFGPSWEFTEQRKMLKVYVSFFFFPLV